MRLSEVKLCYGDIVWNVRFLTYLQEILIEFYYI